MSYPYENIDSLVRRRQRLVVLVAVSALFVLSVLLLLFTQVDSLAQPIVELETVPPSLEQVEWIPELPVRLVIPTLGVDATVQYVGLDSSGSGEMAVPSNFTDVGWYKDGVRPGMDGSAVIAGHYNGKGVPEAVFYNLQTLHVGDEIVIMSERRVEDIFTVVEVRSYEYDEAATEVFQSSDGIARLNLITCGGQWLSEEQRYDKRTVIFAELLTDVE